MNAAEMMLLAIGIPFVAALLIPLLHRHPNVREGVTLTASLLLLITVINLVPSVVDGGRPTIDLMTLLPGIPLRLTLEPLGMLFALVAAGLWLPTAIYSIGYLRGNQEDHQSRFYACFAIALASTMGLAFAGNLLTLFIFYEVLTLSTYPLVTHKGTREARIAGRIYLSLLLGSSILLLLLAICWTWVIAGTLDFTVGGILTGKLEGTELLVLLGLYAFGIGKAALMPFHRWLPAAMVAPTPVSALLHAVAVVKAGVFTVLKVVIYIFGVDLLATTGSSEWLMWVAAVTLLLGSLVAMTKDNLKARLAYSTISQLAYIVLGAALATSMGILGGAMHIAMHAMGKITLFFCAGAIYTATHKTEISQLDGLGRVMPLTFGAFFIGALSIIGLPPFGGAWSKWYLILGAADSGQLVLIGVLLLSSLLNVVYLLPIVVRGFFKPLPHESIPAPPVGHETTLIDGSQVREAPLWCVVPLCVTATGCVLLFFYADRLYRLLLPLVAL